MSSRVRRIGNYATKLVDPSTDNYSDLVARRSERLNAAGVRTPLVKRDPANNAVVSPWIEGTTGQAHLRALRANGTLSHWRELSEADQLRMLEPLVLLHGADQAGMGLEPVDIWRRITPRLAPDVDVPLHGRLENRVRGLYADLRDCQKSMAGGDRDRDRLVPLHGDYHVNQLIIAASTGEPWLLDLDDMALGRPEVDLGNFIANLATTDELWNEGVMDDYVALKAVLCPTYASLGGRAPDPAMVDFHAAVSLLRRLLKFYEQGRGSPDPEDILCVSETLAYHAKTRGVLPDA